MHIFFLAASYAELPVNEVLGWMGLHVEFLRDFDSVSNTCPTPEKLDAFIAGKRAFVKCFYGDFDANKVGYEDGAHMKTFDEVCPLIEKIHDVCIKHVIEPAKDCIDVEKHTNFDKMVAIIKRKSEYVCGLDRSYIEEVVHSMSQCQMSFNSFSHCAYQNVVSSSALANYLTFFSLDTTEKCHTYDENMTCIFNGLCNGVETKFIDLLKKILNEMRKFSNVCVSSVA